MKNFFKNLFRLIGAVLLLIRNVTVIGMLLMAGAAVYFIHIVADVTIDQYQESLIWERTAYDVPLSEVEPALVANVISTDITDAQAAMEELEQYVGDLTGDAISDRDRAESLMVQAEHWQETCGLKSDAITRLSLYLDLEDAIKNAYETLDVKELELSAIRLRDLEMKEETEAGQRYLERVKTVASDFAEAENLLEDTVLSVGEIQNDTWIIPYTYTRTDLTDILDRIRTLQKFPVFAETVNTLSDMADVLNHNRNAREYFEYQNFRSVLDTVSRSSYTAVSSIYTYGQALAARCNIYPEYRDRYTISYESPVTGIYYEGERLEDSQYIRNGAVVTAEIREIYEPVVEPEISVEGEF